ncbi:MAG: hypothetical protein HW421_2635 [Ignavibacteria bacterium]|nr:hypothetical protein [Ignavibacteria bacterium]
MNNIGKIFLYITLIFTFQTANSQTLIDLRAPLNAENFKKWDAYIRTFAPSDSALSVVIHISNYHKFLRRFAAVRECMTLYKPLFPDKEGSFNYELNEAEQSMLMVAPVDNLAPSYARFVIDRAPSEDAFVGVQRLTESYINRKQWDSAAMYYMYFKQYFPTMREKFDTIIEILNTPVENLKINHLNKNINTQFNEWDPTPTPDGKYLYFTSDRPGGFGSMDVWVSEKKDGNWSNATNPGKEVNTKLAETVDNVSADGSGLLFSGNLKNADSSFNIYKIQMTKQGWDTTELFPYPINTKYLDEGAFETSDGKALLFTSDRPGGVGSYQPFGKRFHGDDHGNMDIYVTRKTDTGWSEPINLGNKINTLFAERSPFLHPDGKTLYFSSDGHPGLGRLDVFKSVRLSDTSWTDWSEPLNLGKEINSANNDWGYVVSVSGDSAFFASQDLQGGSGGWDIYSIQLPNRARPENVTVIHGFVTDLKGEPLDAEILWEDLSDGRQVGKLKSNPRDGSFIISLPSGRHYGYYAQKAGYYSISKNIDLKKSTESKEININIILASKKEILKGKITISINNLFFDFDDYSLKQESEPELNRLATFLKDNPKRKIEVEGHTDSIGSSAYNKELSYKRASSVVDYLVGKGIKTGRFRIKGMGDRRPLAGGETDEDMAKNRRVEIMFIK